MSKIYRTTAYTVEELAQAPYEDFVPHTNLIKTGIEAIPAELGLDEQKQGFLTLLNIPTDKSLKSNVQTDYRNFMAVRFVTMAKEMQKIKITKLPIDQFLNERKTYANQLLASTQETLGLNK